MEDMARVCNVVAIVLSFDDIFGAGSSPVFTKKRRFRWNQGNLLPLS